MSNVKALKCVPRPDACVPQVGHARSMSPKLMFDGTPVVLLVCGLKTSVAAEPPLLFNVRVPLLTKSVPAAFVLKVMVLALALAAIIKTTAVIAATCIKRLIVIFLCPPVA